MPVYTYRREDGTTFDYRQKFTDEPLTVDPETGQQVVRVIQPAGVIFKGSGFYVNDSKNASHSAVTPARTDKDKSDKADKPDAAPKTESKPAETTSAASPSPSTTTASAAAD